MRLLLDVHLPRALAAALRRRGIDAVALAEWEGGRYRSAPDSVILARAYEEGRALVSCDCRTIPPLVQQLASTGQHHAGVILVASRSFRPTDVGGLLEALCGLTGQVDDWEDEVAFLKRFP